MSTLEWVGIAATVEHGALAIGLVTAPWWARALVVRVITGERILPWTRR